MLAFPAEEIRQAGSGGAEAFRIATFIPVPATSGREKTGAKQNGFSTQIHIRHFDIGEKKQKQTTTELKNLSQFRLENYKMYEWFSSCRERFVEKQDLLQPV